MVDKFPTVTAMTEKDRLDQEKQLLGIYVTENPISKILAPFRQASLPKISEILNREDNLTVKFVGVVTRFKVIRTKKDNSPMAFVTLSDESGVIEGVVFPKAYQNHLSLLKENQAVYIEGKTNSRNDTKSVLIDLLAENLPDTVKKFDFVIEVPQGSSQSQLMELNRLLKDNPNGHRGLIILPNGKQIPLSYGVKYSQKLQQEIDSILNSR